MIPDQKFLEKFEKGLDTRSLGRSKIPATLIGYGEISAIFQIGDDRTTVYKRMPLFRDTARAEQYASMHRDYCDLLTRAGLTLPQSGTAVVTLPGRPVVLYIAQQKFPSHCVANKVIHTCDRQKAKRLIEQIVSEMMKCWQYNKSCRPEFELALDGQISNWVVMEDQGKPLFYFIDTSTPFIRRNGVEQLDPELLLQSAPAFLRWLLRLFFVDDVMNRYYNPRQVLIDLVANFYKEQLPELVPMAVKTINGITGPDILPLKITDVEKYYREDKFIWTLFLALRRMDRWLTATIFRKRYEFILPGKIRR
ncbi:MAG: hypothetical protein DRH32_01905 [Deltaproteobacteria bacterium]|nr:MAG: hypothetical protein DRH32_01905 [Deltaproteobacteria bacterium]